MLVASVCNPNSLLVPEAEVVEFTSTGLHVYPLTFNPAIELSGKLLAWINSYFKMRIKHATLLCG
jgi:hypothetical protein